MSILFTIASGSGRAEPSAANVAIRLGICQAAAAAGVTQPATFAAGQDVTSDLVAGPLAIACARAARLSGAAHLAYKIPATTAGVISAVTETPAGTGPSITVAGSTLDALTTPWIACTPRVKVTMAGLPGVGKVAVNLDGGTAYPYQYLYDIPAETHATIDGTIDLTGITLSTLTGSTLILDEDVGVAQTVTFTLPANVADIAVQINAQTTNVTGTIIQGMYLRIVSDTVGVASMLSVDASSTADTLLGVSGIAAGSASMITLPGTGLVLTFPSTSAYVLGTVYSFTATAPRHSQAALDTALLAINADPALSFGIVHVVQEPLDATDTLSYSAALATVKTAWEAQAEKRFVHFIVGAPVGETDSALKTAYQGSTASRGVTVTAGDIYALSSAPLPIGSFRTSSSEALAIRLSAYSLSEDPGFGGFGALPDCKMKHADGSTIARNENSATLKLGGSTGPGFTVVRSKGDKPFFVRGVTRAGAASLFVDVGVSRMIDMAATILFAALQKIENLTLELNGDGTISEADATSFEQAFDLALGENVVKKKHASRAFTAINRVDNIVQSRAISVAFTIQGRGQAEDISATLTLVGTLSVSA